MYQALLVESQSLSVSLLNAAAHKSLSFSLCVCVAAALVIVSEVADQANDNLKQGVSLLWMHSMCLEQSDCLAPIELYIFTAQHAVIETRLYIPPGSERAIFRWRSGVKKSDS